MKNKTFKLGEVCRGGVITVQVKGGKAIVIAKEWDMSAGTRKSSNQSNAKEWNRLEVDETLSSSHRQLSDFLHDLTTSYHADQILTWFKANSKIKSVW